MSWAVILTGPARRDLSCLDIQVAERITSALALFAETEHGDVRRLQGSREWRLRIGDWVARFYYDREADNIVVLRVLPRGRAYRN